MRYELFAAPLLLVVSIIVLFALGFFFLYRTQKLIYKSHRANGTVIDLKHQAGEGSGTYSPVVRFTALDGREIEFVERWSQSPPRFQIGDEVLVLYNPQNFQKARVFTTNREMYYSTWLFLGLGGVFLLCGLLMAAVFGTLFYFLGGPGQR